MICIHKQNTAVIIIRRSIPSLTFVAIVDLWILQNYPCRNLNYAKIVMWSSDQSYPWEWECWAAVRIRMYWDHRLAAYCQMMIAECRERCTCWISRISDQILQKKPYFQCVQTLREAALGPGHKLSQTNVLWRLGPEGALTLLKSALLDRSD